jgi:hypothetical protein
MTITMNDSHMVSICQVEEFTKGAALITFEGKSRQEKCAWIEATLARFHYRALKRREKTTLKNYAMQITGYSDAQITRLIAKKKKVGKIMATSTKRHCFTTTYTTDDIALLAATDTAHSRLSGPATKAIFKRMYEVFKDTRFVRLKNISVAHLYNLRGKRQYQSNTAFFEKTKPVKIAIGTRRKPDPRGNPGYIRIDTVHQGDLDKQKGGVSHQLRGFSNPMGDYRMHRKDIREFFGAAFGGFDCSVSFPYRGIPLG